MEDEELSLSEELWRHRGILEELLYKFTTQQLLLTHGESRWLGHCAAEIEALKNQLSVSQLTVDQLSSAVAERWGLAAGSIPTLCQLSAAAPQDGPWGELLRDHETAIRCLTDEMKAVSEENIRHLRTARRAKAGRKR